MRVLLQTIVIDKYFTTAFGFFFANVFTSLYCTFPFSETKNQYFYQPTLKLVMEGMASKSEGSLMDLFMSFGKVVKLSKAGDVAFVTFFRETEGLYEAVRHLNSLAIGGSKLKVQVVTEGRCTTVCRK